MSKRRKLAPHELARRDQAFAWASEHVTAGDLVMVVQSTTGGNQCCWCDCPAPPGSAHATPGYVCPDPCPAEAASSVQISTTTTRSTYLVCDRHQTGPLEQLVVLGIGEVVVGPSWLDS